MSKTKSIWYCTDCGNEYSRWSGKCTSCGAWNTLVEEVVSAKTQKIKDKKEAPKVKKLNEAGQLNYSRVKSGSIEFDRVLGGGFVAGSLTLIGGEPGIGKSTLILQTCDKVKIEEPVLYVSGEESIEQIKLRADRLGIDNENIYFLGETDMDKIEVAIDEIKPGFLIIDSIQTIFSEEISSAPGSVSQVREVTAKLMRICKSKKITTIIVGHVTKDGNIAGPRVLEHMVDTVLYIEGERYFSYRVLRTVKNRFGSTNEIGMFEMKEEGLVEVLNPSNIFVEERDSDATGTAVTVSLEGTRAILLEIQTLTTTTVFGMPRRNSNGLDYNKLTLLLAVLEKHGGLNFSNQDVYLNIAGGIRISEPGIDLAVIVAAASSYMSKSTNQKLVAVGEVGLTGEVRAVNQIVKRINEAEKLGYKRIILPYSNYKSLNKKDISNYTIELKPVKNIYQALKESDLI